MGTVLVGRRQARLDAVRESLGAGAPALIVPAEIASAEARAPLLEAVEERLSSEGGRLRSYARFRVTRPDQAARFSVSFSAMPSVNVTLRVPAVVFLLPLAGQTRDHAW
ncbi:MAG: hypothetical protein U5K36_09295 [Roseovarius sp.]|nr:hypothetical protein [Roseovarius sp.]